MSAWYIYWGKIIFTVTEFAVGVTIGLDFLLPSREHRISRHCRLLTLIRIKELRKWSRDRTGTCRLRKWENALIELCTSAVTQFAGREDPEHVTMPPQIRPKIDSTPGLGRKL
jgi:hypothetical protein